MKKPDLHNEKIEAGFQIPDDYFRTLETRIMDKVFNESKVIPFYKATWFKGVAAVLIPVLLATGWYQFFYHSPQEINIKQLENYLSFHSEISEYELLTQISPDDLYTLEESYYQQMEYGNNNHSTNE